MTTVTKTVKFDAAHVLTDHQGLCRNLHGHTYRVDVSVSAEADGDMIVVSDGENYYAYLMSCAPERVIGVGESTNMVCSTVATNIWTSSVPSDYRPYVEVTNDPDDRRVHSTTAAVQRPPPMSHGFTTFVTPPTVTLIARPGTSSHVSAKCSTTRYEPDGNGR